jgi:hypothetical protein
MAKRSFPKPVLNFPDKVADVLVFCRHVALCMTGNKYVTVTRIPIPQLSTDVEALATAEANAKGRAPGTVETRDQALEVVQNDCESLLGDVNSACAAAPANASLIIESCGFSEHKTTTPGAKPPAKVLYPGAPGEAQVFLKAVKRGASYHWMISMDGGVTWVDGGMTTVADQIFPGLTPGKAYSVKWRSTLVRTTSEFSQPFTFLMH